MKKHLNILGIRGLPAAHGGFETFAHHFAPFMLSRGWSVTVYCQHDSRDLNSPKNGFIDTWNGIKRVHITAPGEGPASTMLFDLKATLHAIRTPGVDLVLGYNTAIFTVIQRLFGRRVIINMDGIEWKRSKWSWPAKTWFWINEWLGARLSQVPIADHPEIAAHLNRMGATCTTIIPYASEKIDNASPEHIELLGLRARDYFISIARIEPENSILELVKAFEMAATGRRLVVLGRLDPKNKYHREVAAAAGPNVLFTGAIYDKNVVQALRYYSLAYLHGHQVGGTNPSLVEALGAGRPVIAHDNKFNRWTAGSQLFFHDIEECMKAMQAISDNPATFELLATQALDLHSERYDFAKIHEAYFSAVTSELEKTEGTESSSRRAAELTDKQKQSAGR